MSKPKLANIGTLEYVIEYVDGLRDGIELLYGQHLHSDIKIKISSDSPEDRQRETFVHECLHAIDSRYLNNKLEEDHISILAHGIFDWMRTNKDAIKWVMNSK